jgi:toxin CcdB
VAQFDVFLTRGGDYLVDVQSDLLDHFATRLVVPLLDPALAPKPIARLNPAFSVDGRELLLYPQFALAVPVSEFSRQIASLDEHHFTITAAMDMLLTGY